MDRFYFQPQTVDKAYLLFKQENDILPSYMIGVEWGSKRVPRENRRPLPLTRLSGEQLQEIDTTVTKYLQEHPTETRADAVSALTLIEKEAKRMEAGLDILNQLAVVGRNGNDVKIVIVYQDLNHIVQSAPEGKKERTGVSKPHLYYEIDWIREPLEEPKPPVQPVAKPPVKHTPREIKEQRRVNERRFREKQAAIRKEEEQLKAEREAIDNVVFDRVREFCQNLIDNKNIKIELGENGIAVILYTEDSSEPYKLVDRETGKYYAYSGRIDAALGRYRKVIHPKWLNYFTILAEQAEGKEATYSPAPLTLEVCEDIYQRALKAGVIIFNLNPGKRAMFLYKDSAYLYGLSNYRVMDLERNVVDVDDNRTRPIHPDFAKFLKRKKAELDFSEVSRI